MAINFQSGEMPAIPQSWILGSLSGPIVREVELRSHPCAKRVRKDWVPASCWKGNFPKVLGWVLGGPLIAIKPRWGTDLPIREAQAGGWIGEWATCLQWGISVKTQRLPENSPQNLRTTATSPQLGYRREMVLKPVLSVQAAG